jgi:Kef-type K+ transport system membrane component KefB
MLVALSFAVAISLVPAFIFVETPWRAVTFVAVALAAPPTVWVLQWIARMRRLDERRVFTWAAAGAMAFDGLAIGFIPALYGQTGQALAWTASALLFAFASLIVAGQLMLGNVVPAPQR